MKLKAFAVRDSKAEVFSQPMFAVSEGVAIRAFADAASDPKHDYGKYPDDFTLFHIGEYDDQKGELIPLPTGPRSLGLAATFKTERS